MDAEGPMVYEFYKRPRLELSNVKCTPEGVYHALDNQGIQLLGQIKHGSCHARAILFKVLADTVGLDSKVLMGLPSDGVLEPTGSHLHMSVVVEHNSVELLVDLMRNPGQLIPCSTKALFMSHMFLTVESDFSENDSCDSPLEPNSPVCGPLEQVDDEGPEHLLVPGRGRSILGCHRHSFKDYTNDMTSSRVARAMNASLKQNLLPREQVDKQCNASGHQENVPVFLLEDEYDSCEKVKSDQLHIRQINCAKTISLPSSPHLSGVQTSRRGESEKSVETADMISAWNNVLESSAAVNNQLFPFQEWK